MEASKPLVRKATRIKRRCNILPYEASMEDSLRRHPSSTKLVIVGLQSLCEGHANIVQLGVVAFALLGEVHVQTVAVLMLALLNIFPRKLSLMALLHSYPRKLSS